jgi:hypothetical protein
MNKMVCKIRTDLRAFYNHPMNDGVFESIAELQLCLLEKEKQTSHSATKCTRWCYTNKLLIIIRKEKL